MHPSAFRCVGLILGSSLILTGFCPAQTKLETPQDAYVKVINACEVKLPQAWKAGMDVTFRDKSLGSDIRPAEVSPYAKISFDGKDHVDIQMTQTKTPTASVPADFEKGCFYSVILTGLVSEAGTKVVPVVRKDFPEDPAKVRDGFARIKVLNTISSFPLAVAAGGASYGALPVGEAMDFYLPAGDQTLNLKFKDVKNRDQIMKHGLILRAGGSYSVIVLNSSEGGNRPIFFQSDDALEHKNILAQQEADEKEKKSKAGIAAPSPTPTP